MISQLRSLVLSNPEDEGGFGSQQEMTPCPETATTHQLRHTLCASSDPVRTKGAHSARFSAGDCSQRRSGKNKQTVQKKPMMF